MSHITLITCGGTIDKAYGTGKGVYDLHIGDSAMPSLLASHAYGHTFEHIALLQKDSLDMTEEDRSLVRDTIARLECEHVIITHGTDTLIETARVLLGIVGKTVILVGASMPYVLKNTDAEFNIGCAVGWVTALPHGIYVSMGWRYFSPLDVEKGTDGRFSNIH
jgi:L-asparaginase